MKHTGITVGLALLLTLFFLASCIETNRTLGSALVPTNQDISIHTATLDIPVTLRMADSLQTAVSNSMSVGAIRSGVFGLFPDGDRDRGGFCLPESGSNYNKYIRFLHSFRPPYP